MKPVAILQHEASQGPGILLDHLRQQDIAHVLIDPCAEGAAPANARDYRGIIVLGSNHCANEQLLWIDEERCLLQSGASNQGLRPWLASVGLRSRSAGQAGIHCCRGGCQFRT